MGVQQEVCHKHRNIRRENDLRVRAPKSWQRCLFFIVESGADRMLSKAFTVPLVSRSSFKSRMPECQSGDAGATPADRTIHTIQYAAGASMRSRASKTLRVRGSTGTPCHCVSSSNQLRGSQVGRQRPHKPPKSGFDSRPRDHPPFSKGRSISQEVTRLASGRARSKAAAVHHFPNAGRLGTNKVS